MVTKPSSAVAEETGDAEPVAIRSIDVVRNPYSGAVGFTYSLHCSSFWQPILWLGSYNIVFG